MPDDEVPNNHPEEDEEDGDHPYASGVNEVLEAVANVIEKDRFV